MDKKYNESWVVIIGQGFAFEVTHEVKHVLWMFLSDLSALVYKGASTSPPAPPSLDLPTPSSAPCALGPHPCVRAGSVSPC